MSTHIIHKQKVIVNITGIDNAFSYQNTLSNLFANDLTTSMEDVLDAMDTPGTVIRIDKLKLDLGEINAAHFADEFKEKLLYQLKHSIHTIYNKQEANVTIAKQSQSLKEGFIYFIKTGTLPWYIKAKDMAGFEADIFNKWSETDWVFITDWFYSNIISYKQITERLVLQFSDNFLKQMLSSALKETIGDSEWKMLLNDLEYLYNKPDLFNEQHTNISPASKKYLIKVFDLLFNKNKSYTLNVLIAEQLVSSVIKNNSAVILSKQHDFITKNIQSNLISTIIKNIFFFHQNGIPLQRISIKDFLQKGVPEENLISRFKSGKENEDPKEELHVNKKTQLNEKQNIAALKPGIFSGEDVLFVDNCGVILLHPFLESYFNELLLIQNKNFISEEAQKKAVLLLHYLSTGLTEAAEFNLVLEKILCGYISEESLPATINLSQQEIYESAKLLQAVIDYWTPLKHTSVEGLQKTFLQRQGKLTATETGWQLIVEQKTVDILLGKLPWGFSTIKLPWMQNVLNTDWC